MRWMSSISACTTPSLFTHCRARAAATFWAIQFSKLSDSSARVGPTARVKLGRSRRRRSSPQILRYPARLFDRISRTLPEIALRRRSVRWERGSYRRDAVRRLLVCSTRVLTSASPLRGRAAAPRGGPCMPACRDENLEHIITTSQVRIVSRNLRVALTPFRACDRAPLARTGSLGHFEMCDCV